jgi:hypothetical protein
VLADNGYASDAFRPACRDRGTEPIILKRQTTGVKGLGASCATSSNRPSPCCTRDRVSSFEGLFVLVLHYWGDSFIWAATAPS